jgi:hypothetical protein
MLGLNSIPLEAALPGHTRRRTWSHPELSSHTVLVLTFDRLYLAPLTGSPKPEVLAAIEAGADLDALLGPLTTVIDLVAIRQLKLDLLTNSLNIEYAGSGELGRSRLRLTFATHEAADACFTKIWRRLGDGFQLAPYQRDTWHSVRGPLGLLAIILVITAMLAGILSIHEDMASTRVSAHMSHTATGEIGVAGDLPKSQWDLLLNWLNWKVVCGLGGVAAAFSQVWLYRRLTTPPVALELIQT